MAFAAARPPELTLRLEQDAAGTARLALTAKADAGEAGRVYPFTPVESTATPTP